MTQTPSQQFITGLSYRIQTSNQRRPIDVSSPREVSAGSYEVWDTGLVIRGRGAQILRCPEWIKFERFECMRSLANNTAIEVGKPALTHAHFAPRTG